MSKNRWTREDGTFEPQHKARFQSAGKRVLRELALRTGYTSEEAKKYIRLSPGGHGIMGEVVLHTPHFYVVVGGDPGVVMGVLWRSVQGLKDYVGGQNNWTTFEKLQNGGIDADLRRLKERE